MSAIPRRRAAVSAVAWTMVLAVFLAAAPAWAARAPRPPAKPPVSPPPSSDAVIVGEAINRFAWNLHGRLASKPGNLFYSPQSISTALAMTYGGARGQTATQMESVLGFQPDRPVRPEWVAKAYADLLGGLRGDPKTQGFELAVANALWGQKGYGFVPDFLGLCKTHYGAGLTEVDFVRDTEGARKTINLWVEKETRDKIKDLIPPGVLDDLTRLVLTNAIYFKGFWEHAFEKKQTRDEDFFVAPGKKAPVPMMQQTGHFGHFDGGDFQALEMPYKGEALAMVVLLPKKQDGLADLEKTLSAAKVAGWVAKLQRREAQVALPRFKTTAQFSLKDALSAMGMTLAFTPDKADFSGMNGKKDLFISAVIHKAFVDVNEEGTEAAAATAVVVALAMAPAEPPPVFRADHPFLFLIRDVRTGCILFMGRVADPKA